MIVMCVCHFDDTNAIGGLEKQARKLSQVIGQQGKQVVVLSSTRKLSNAGWCERDGVRTRLFWTYDTPQVSGKKLPAALIWAFQLLVWVIWNRKKIEVIHGHQIRIHAFVGAIGNKFLRIPHILKSGTGGAGADIKAIGSYKYFGSAGRKFVIKNTTKFIATTETIRDDLLSFNVPLTKVEIIPNGLSIPSVENEMAPAPPYNRFVFLGRLDEDKNVLALAEAAESIFQKTKGDYQLDIFGRGPLEQALSEAVSRYRHVKYSGFVENTWSVLPHYHYLLLPSSGEGLSNAMLEAMSCGVVPVTTRVSGCVDHIVDGVNGFFLDGTDVGSIKRTLEKVVNLDVQSWQRISAQTRTHAQQNFSIEDVATRYTALYERLRDE